MVELSTETIAIVLILLFVHAVYYVYQEYLRIWEEIGYLKRRNSYLDSTGGEWGRSLRTGDVLPPLPNHPLTRAGSLSPWGGLSPFQMPLWPDKGSIPPVFNYHTVPAKVNPMPASKKEEEDLSSLVEMVERTYSQEGETGEAGSGEEEGREKVEEKAKVSRHSRPRRVRAGKHAAKLAEEPPV